MSQWEPRGGGSADFIARWALFFFLFFFCGRFDACNIHTCFNISNMHGIVIFKRIASVVVIVVTVEHIGKMEQKSIRVGELQQGSIEEETDVP